MKNQRDFSSDFGLHHLGVVSVLGCDILETITSLSKNKSDVSYNNHEGWKHWTLINGRSTLVGQVPCEPPPFLEPFQNSLKDYDCRNHRLAAMALEQIRPEVCKWIKKFGEDRIGVVVGSSTSGLDGTESAYLEWVHQNTISEKYSFEHQQQMASVADFVRHYLHISGPSYCVSTACSSSAKVFASARALLKYGICDAVIVGGVDALCNVTLNGFESLASLSMTKINPLSQNRDGLNIGEAAAFFIMSRAEDYIEKPAQVYLCGVGESSDAHHISAPHPEGLGAEVSMRKALEMARLEPTDIAYINLHGTGTPLNDAMESLAVSRIFTNAPFCSSSKPLTGHCLGAAGALEAALCFLGLKQKIALPKHIYDGEYDKTLPRLNLVREEVKKGGFWLSNSFAFGGSNCSLIFGVSDES